MSQGDNKMLKELLFERFMARDSGDEPEDNLKLSGNREVDIEVDGDFICDYTSCETARDFEIATTKNIEKRARCDIKKNDYKLKVWKKFCKLSKQKGWKMPRLDDLVMYMRRPDCYQDKLKFYEELIIAFNDDILEEFGTVKNDDGWEMPW